MTEDKIITKIDELKEELNRNKSHQPDYTFEKKKLYHTLGNSLIETLKKYRAFVAGGFITSLFCNRDFNDIDIYFRNPESAAGFMREIISDKNWIVTHTKKATLFQYKINDGYIMCQVIHFDYFEDVNDIFKHFDFTVCMGAFDFDNDTFVFHKDFFKHNSQRILKFNENTTYPIISAMRVQKYVQKGYKISKPELVKIFLTCANLKIGSYEQLKSQIGGMYGIEYDKIIKPKDGEEFNLAKEIRKFGDLALSDDYFEKNHREVPDDLDYLIYDITGVKCKVFKIENKYYEMGKDGFQSVDVDGKYADQFEILPIEQAIKFPLKFYKYVKKDDDVLRSYYEEKFTYPIGQVVTAFGDSPSSGIYGGLSKTGSYQYKNNNDSVLIELEIDSPDDIKDFNTFKVKKAKVIRVVPESEYNGTETSPWE